MTAPQHTAQQKADQQKADKTDRRSSIRSSNSHKAPQSHKAQSHKTQRCWFVALGLVGGFGFVASQVSFARAEGDFLIDDYAASSDAATLGGGYSVADTTFSLPAPALQATPNIQPLPEAFIDAPPAPSVAAEAFSLRATSSYTPSAPPTPAPAVVAPTVAATPAPSITIEIQPAQTAPTSSSSENSPTESPAVNPRVRPHVTQVAPPTFASVRKPLAAKVHRRKNPLTGLIEAGALAVPLSAYVSNQRGFQSDLQGNLQNAEALGAVEVSNRTVRLVAMNEEAVPEIYPAAEAAPPTVEFEPAQQQATPIEPTELVPAALPAGTNVPEEYNSIFVDPTDYNVGATESPNAAPEVVISEQSTGCEFTVGSGQAVPNGACATGLSPAPQVTPQSGYAQTPSNSLNESGYSENASVASAPAVNVGPVSFSASGIRFSSGTTVAGREYLNRSVRPLVNLQAAQQFIFPLAIPSPITSLFGFRVHPISGDYRFHSGTDIGAEHGTPVLAAQSGTVVSADYAGGYGLMVVLNHKVEGTELESRYAHLSDILVEPGTKVRKGDVIGLVGSTGNSTGPHLHFEMLQNTADGWVLINPDSLVQNSLANLVRALNNPMQAMNFSLSDLTLNLNNLKKTPVPGRSGSSVTLPLLPGQNGVSFRPAQPNAS